MKTKKHKQRVCPKCGSTNISTYVPGLISPETAEKEHPGVIYTGCIIGHNDPKYHCNGCNTDFYEDMTEWQDKPKPEWSDISYREDVISNVSDDVRFRNKVESVLTIAMIIACIWIFYKYV